MGSVDLSSDRWVVLSRVAHGDGAWIVRVFSRELGVVAVWAPVGKARQRKVGAYHPCSLLEAHGIRRKGSEGLFRFAEVRRAMPLDVLVTDVRRSAVAFFLSEVMWRTFPEEHAHPEVADLLWNAAADLAQTQSPQHVHLHFLASLIDHLGLAPEAQPPGPALGLNLATGEWTPVPLADIDQWPPETAAAFAALVAMAREGGPAPLIGSAIRRQLVAGMVRYIQHHLSGPKTIKSLDVLEAVFA